MRNPLSEMPREVLIRRLQAHKPRPPTLPPSLLRSLRPAAVLVPLFWRDGEWHVLLTRRTDTVPRHRGQVALPGGVQEPGDVDIVAVALREAHEELGITPNVVDVIGVLDPQPVVTGYLVHPVVGIIPAGFPLSPAPDEIARVFDVPLSWLAQPHRVRVEYRQWARIRYPVYFYEPYDGEVIWGLTARVLRNLLGVLFMERSFIE